MNRFIQSINIHELIRPLGQLTVFSLGSAIVLSAMALLLALALDQTAVGLALQDKYNVTLYTYTLINLQ